MILVEIVWTKINPFTTLSIFWKAILAMCVWMKMALLAMVDACVCRALYTVLYMGSNSHTEYSSQVQIVLLPTDSANCIYL